MPEVILAGSLHHVPVAALLQIVAAESLTGIVRLLGTPTVLHARGGSVVQAEDGPRTGIVAVLGAFFVSADRFEIVEHEVVGEPIGSTMGLVMEGLRVVDEWERLSSLVLVSTADPDWTPSPVLRAVLEHLDGDRPLAEAAVLARRSPPELVDEVLRAMEEGFVTARGPSKPQRAANAANLLDIDVDDLVLEARSLIKSREYDAALVVLKQALAVAPDHAIAGQNLRRLEALRATADVA